MINLLPPTEKQELKYYYIFHFILAIGIYCILFIFILTALNIGIFYFLKFYEKSLNANIEASLSDEDIKEIKLLEEKFIDFNNKLIIFKTETSRKRAYEFFRKFSQDLPENIKVIGLTYSVDDKNNFKIFFQGYAPTREAFLAFIENLKADKTYKNIVSPIQNIIKPIDVEFSINFEL